MMIEKPAFLLNIKRTLLILRWLVFIIILFLIIYMPNDVSRGVGQLLWLLIFFIISNLVLIFLPERWFSTARLNTIMFAIDVLILSYGIYLTQGAQTDLYLVYFVIIFMASGGQDVKFTVPLTGVASLIYAWLVFQQRGATELMSPMLLIRIPFLFIVSLVFNYYAQEDRSRSKERLQRIERLSLLGELNAGIMHELKTPLTTIVGFSGLMDKIDTIEEKEKVIEKISREAVRAKNIILKILQFSSQGVSEKKSLNMNELVENCLVIVEDQLKMDKVTIEKHLLPELPLVEADSQQIEQVFLNLINNACQAMREQTGDRKLTIVSEKIMNRVVVRFIDTGPGIKPEHVNKIFDPFFTTKKQSEGTGLGLSICYQIIDSHKGKIYVYSEYGKGATFVVELPVSKKIVHS